MSKFITAKIDVTKIQKEHLFKGVKGTYLDVVIFENSKGPDNLGFTHRIIQSVSKEAREQGVRGAIIGNLKMSAGGQQEEYRQTQRLQSRPQQAPQQNGDWGDDTSEIPF